MSKMSRHTTLQDEPKTWKRITKNFLAVWTNISKLDYVKNKKNKKQTKTEEHIFQRNQRDKLKYSLTKLRKPKIMLKIRIRAVNGVLYHS